MSELTQLEANALINLEKHRVDDFLHQYPTLGGALTIPLTSLDNREKFTLDITRGRINMRKVTYQNRARSVIVLLRLDIEGPSHTNPNDVIIPCPHLHVYREGYGTKWAIPAPNLDFPNLSDLWMTLEDFMQYCHVTKPPIIERGLFV